MTVPAHDGIDGASRMPAVTASASTAINRPLKERRGRRGSVVGRWEPTWLLGAPNCPYAAGSAAPVNDAPRGAGTTGPSEIRDMGIVLEVTG